VDVYSLGVVLFEMLSAARPFDGASRTRADVAPLASAKAADPMKKRLRGDLDAVIAKALEPDPAQRYRSIAAFSDDLQRHLRHEPVTARRVGKITTLVRFA